MGLLVCFCCGRQKEISPIKRGTRYKCSNCGAKRVRIIRSRAHASYVSWSDREGGDGEDARHQTYSGLKKFAEHRGYKNGWIGNKFKEIFGRWPNGEAVESAAPASNGLLRWIRQENAAYAKKKRQEGDGMANVWDRGSVRESGNVDGDSPLMNEEDWGVKWG